MRITGIIAVAAVLCIGAASATAETLQDRLTGLFVQALQVQRSGGVDDPFGITGATAVESNARIVSALSTLVSTSLSTFPLSSTSQGITFDFAGGVPVATHTSTGPVFSEKAETLGKGKATFGFNFTTRNLSKVRGVETEDVLFNFVHRDIDGDGFIGEQNAEYDYIVLFPHMDLDATVMATYFSYGLTDKIDVGIAIPFLSVDITLTPEARINSETFARTGGATYFYDGTSSSPVLGGALPSVNEGATGFGDIALRGKYHFLDRTVDLAFLGEIRLPTGSEDDFLGTGSTTLKMMLVGSTVMNDFSPHFNFGYDFRGDKDRDNVEMSIGWDQRVSDKVTLAVDWIGQFEVGGEADDRAFPDPVPIGPVSGTDQTVVLNVAPSNIPNQLTDNVINVSFGAKYAPSEKFLFMGNVILPTNEDGLRSTAITTIGLEFSL